MAFNQQKAYKKSLTNARDVLIKNYTHYYLLKNYQRIIKKVLKRKRSDNKFHSFFVYIFRYLAGGI